MVVVETCRLSGPSRIVMNRARQTPLHRSLSIHRRIAPTIQNFKFVGYAAVCFLLLLLSVEQHAFGQSDFESHLADAVSAQSSGNISAAIAAYQSALAIRR